MIVSCYSVRPVTWAPSKLLELSRALPQEVLVRWPAAAISHWRYGAALARWEVIAHSCGGQTPGVMRSKTPNGPS